MLLDPLWGLFSNDLAIDLGTSNTLVYAKGKGIVLSEPSVVAVISLAGIVYSKSVRIAGDKMDEATHHHNRWPSIHGRGGFRKGS